MNMLPLDHCFFIVRTDPELQITFVHFLLLPLALLGRVLIAVNVDDNRDILWLLGLKVISLKVTLRFENMNEYCPVLVG